MERIPHITQKEAVTALQVYFIDTENVANAWTALLPVMRKNSRVLLFYTKTSPTMRMESLDALLARTRAVEPICCAAGLPGSSALDFQLVTELGRRVAERPDWEYLIVSRDQDYDPVVEYWTNRGIRVSRVVPETSSHATEVNAKLSALAAARKPAAAQAEPETGLVAARAPSGPAEAAGPATVRKAPLPPKPAQKTALAAQTKAVRNTYKSRISGIGLETCHIQPTVNAMVKGLRNEPDKDRVALFETCLPQFVGVKSAAKYISVLRPIVEDIDLRGPIPPKA